jgi:hypothetical protein
MTAWLLRGGELARRRRKSSLKLKFQIPIRHTLLAESRSLITVEKFPVPMSREFGSN